ncbi:DUF3320 domain-containing protein [Brenneria tiliae]|uniref:DUF3320 domain-containing protein n=1 Tax=Brenneria tiliae TaxID=2914984 RepID=A0ABT0N0S6_9GAMM|nr:DUF3320 domain-containing protein [Brenneria tiliae]MCL2895039.1 DUF3320 domain-containing protein [Brenneria tiliae]
MSIVLDGSITKKIGFASHQNAVPILRELVVNNHGENDYENLLLTLTSSPTFLESKNWTIDRLAAGNSIFIPDRDIKLDAAYLFSLMESVKGDVTITLSDNDTVIATTTYPIEVLAKNEWGGDSMSELIAAFIMPNDPAVDKILKATSDVLRRAGKNDALDGYEAQSRGRCWELASGLWSAIASLRLSYALPPASFETRGQKIRPPASIMDGQVATCLDSALLFAAALEQMGLNPLVIITEGHAFAGLWLQPQEFSNLINEDVSAVRKRIDLKEMIVFETTLATKFPAPSFSQAIESAKRQLTDQDFMMAVDIRRARMQKIRPLALATTSSAIKLPSQEANEVINEALEQAPVLPSFDVEIKLDNENSAVNKLTIWQRKLLDLTTRNRLLHLPTSAKGVRLICPSPAELEDKLADGKSIRVVAMPDLETGGRDIDLYQQQNNESLHEEYARIALEKGEVLATLEKNKLEASLIELYRKARSDLDEGGANTLFLAIGFLKWKKSADDPRSYSAPLILLPIQLERKSALSGVTMRMLEEEPRFNLTLLELLRHDFLLTIPGLEGELPTDESGIDVEGVWNTVRRAVRDIPGFEVTRELVIGTFSFAKYLMWKDLVDRSEQLMQNPLVKYLIERGTGNEALVSAGEFLPAEILDNKIKAENLFIPLPVDSSQLSAIVASASGKDFVLDGPPGTGKSQTIANMIAHNLALGRRVLFVAEKKAALDVVYRRLENKGLGEFCVELHSSKTSKMEFLKQLERAWDTRDTLSAEEWKAEALHAQRLREKLNGIVNVLHKRWPNGLTVHQAIGRVIRDANDATPKLVWPAGTFHDLAEMERFRDVARRLDLNGETAKRHSGKFDSILKIEWSNGWQESIVTVAREVPKKIEELQEVATGLLAATGLELDGTDPDSLRKLTDFTALLLEAYGFDLSFMFSPNVGSKANVAMNAVELIRSFRSLENELSVVYTADLYRRINIEQIEQDWKAAEKKLWFFSSLAKKKVTRDLAMQGGASGTPDVAGDVVKLRRIREYLIDIEGMASDLSDVPGWNGANTDLNKFGEAITLADRIRSVMSALAKSAQHLSELRSSVSTLIVDSNDLLAEDGNIIACLAKLERAISDYETIAERFNNLLGHAEDNVHQLSELKDTALNIVQRQTSLKAWCDWCRVRQEADSMGLQPLTEAMVKNALPEGQIANIFETAYSRWFAAWVIDSEPMLHNFVPVEHMSDIDAYRKQDDRLSQLAVRYIRAKLCGFIPAKNEVGKQGGFGILKHELQKSRRHKPVRQLASDMGDAMSKLAPCMLMSPLSIAQFLPTNQALFDLVIFDEASQISPWDAIGSIARGKQVVIAGDPRQMPPTSFFSRGANDTEDDTEEDMESILDECLAAGIHNHSLSWHYRSRHESLIAFSNHRYYDSNLITFPAALTKKSTVEWRRVDGVYTKGKGRHNQAEAEAIVAETVKRLTDPNFTKQGSSIGIITLNSEQQRLISDLLDRARQQYPSIEHYFQDDLAEPVVVKNLETVQGDERDVIMLGVGYGPTEPGANTMSMNFGPLNKEGGWRRLNVAITRARQEMLVFTSFDASMIDLNRTSARAVQDLKHFIEFAQRGPVALAQAVRGSVGGYDSPFEEAVAQGLRQKGWNVVPQIGVSRFRIDLGIVHPDRPGDYLVGVECDGATYHSAATARDRDKVRSAILSGLGWKLVRVWSTDWWIDKNGALERLHCAIEDLLEKSRTAFALVEEERLSTEASNNDVESVGNIILADDGERDVPTSIYSLPDEAINVHVVETDNDGIQREVESSIVEQKVAKNCVYQGAINLGKLKPEKYKVTDFSTFTAKISPDSFYDSSYDETLHEMVEHVLRNEAPILDSVLVKRIARSHGFNRAGRLIRERVLEIVDKHHFIKPDLVEGEFVWGSQEQSENWSHVRLPDTEEDIRSMGEIPYEEIKLLAESVRNGDRAVEIARILGFKRVANSARERIEAVIKTEQD